MPQDFRTMIASDQEHEKVFVEIYYRDKFVALVSQEDNIPMVEMPGGGLDESCILRVVPFKEFQAALEDAVQRLKG